MYKINSKHYRQLLGLLLTAFFILNSFSPCFAKVLYSSQPKTTPGIQNFYLSDSKTTIQAENSVYRELSIHEYPFLLRGSLNPTYIGVLYKIENRSDQTHTITLNQVSSFDTAMKNVRYNRVRLSTPLMLIPDGLYKAGKTLITPYIWGMTGQENSVSPASRMLDCALVNTLALPITTPIAGIYLVESVGITALALPITILAEPFLYFRDKKNDGLSEQDVKGRDFKADKTVIELPAGQQTTFSVLKRTDFPSEFTIQ